MPPFDSLVRVDASDWPVDRVEPTGSTEVTWLLEPNTGSTRVKWLHKSVTIHEWGTQGEDWAEAVSTLVAQALGVPCAEVRLCVRGGQLGSLSRSLKEDGYSFNDGGMALEVMRAPGYFRHAEGAKAIDPTRPDIVRPGHTLSNIRQLLSSHAPPRGYTGPPSGSAFDAFAGFMMLDALVANRDRHEQNWAVLRGELLGMTDKLAGSFDHGGSLGYNLQDSKRERLLSDPRMLAGFASKGLAHRFEHSRSATAPMLTRHAATALAMCPPDARRWWLTRLWELDLTSLRMRLERGVEGVSPVALEFAMSLIELNVERMRHELGTA